MAHDHHRSRPARPGRRRRPDPRRPPPLRGAAARPARQQLRPRRRTPGVRRAARRARRGRGGARLPEAPHASTRSASTRPSTARRSTPRATRRCWRCSSSKGTDTQAFDDAVEELAKVVNHHLTEEELTILNPAREEVAEQVRAELGRAVRHRAQRPDRRGLRHRSRTCAGSSPTPARRACSTTRTTRTETAAGRSVDVDADAGVLPGPAGRLAGPPVGPRAPGDQGRSRPAGGQDLRLPRRRRGRREGRAPPARSPTSGWPATPSDASVMALHRPLRAGTTCPSAARSRTTSCSRPSTSPTGWWSRELPKKHRPEGWDA